MIKKPSNSSILTELMETTFFLNNQVSTGQRLKFFLHPAYCACGQPLGFVKGTAAQYIKTCGNKTCVTNLVSSTNIELYGSANPFASPIIKERIKQTMLDKYGEDNPQKVKEIKEKTKKTCLIKYGVDNPFAAEIIKDKIKRTLQKHYGVDNPGQSSIIKKKSDKTLFKNHGVTG